MDLAKTQLLSLVTKAVTTGLGIIQSVIIVRILSPAEFGLVGLVMSIGSVIGVSQHLGVVDGAIREIAIRNKKRDIAHIVWASHIVRQIVTVPLSAILFFLAPIVANRYGYPEITPYIQVFSVALILQGLQDVWGATLTGMKRFTQLYIVQIITAAINIAVFGWLTWRYGISGFFWAVIGTTAIMVALLMFDSLRALWGQARLPNVAEFRAVARQIIRIGAYTYLARIFFVLWQRLPLLVLGAALATDELGYLNISMTFGSKLTIIAMALSEVNLSWMSSLFAADRKQFAAQATRNMHRVLVLMLGLTLVMLFFAPEIIQYVIGGEYAAAEPIILIMTAAFFLYALIDIGTSSVFVPADNPRHRAITFGVLTLISGALLVWLLTTSPHSLWAAAVMLFSAFVSFILMVILARRYSVNMAPPALLGLLGLLAASIAWLFTGPSLWWRLPVFLVLAGYVWWEAHRQELLPSIASLRRTKTATAKQAIVYFAGAAYQQPSWTNRQHIATGLSKQYSILYIEPRVWIFRHVIKNLRHPLLLAKFMWRLIAWERISSSLVIVSQWNLLPGSRESRIVSTINHVLNRYCLLLKAKLLGYLPANVMWIYDTEAAEYLSAFPDSLVFYDCVDDHAAQSGVDRNSKRVDEEEHAILKRADIVTTTSHRLFELKRKQNPHTHLVLNAGDVDEYLKPTPAPARLVEQLRKIKADGPILGSVGALDSYKVDFDLLLRAAKTNPQWQFVFIGRPIVDRSRAIPKTLRKLPNVHFLGEVDRRHVPALVHQFDVCLIPYKHNRYNQASFPLKFWEFMATGKPIVVSGVPELKQYAPLISYAKNAKEFTVGIQRAVANNAVRAAERIREAKKHSWKDRVTQLLTLLEKTI